MSQNHDYNFKTTSDRPTIRYEFDDIEPNDSQTTNDIEVVSATFSMRNVSTGKKTADGKTATIVDEDDGVLSGVVEYQLSPSETSNAGVYIAEFELTYRDGSTRRVPQDHNITIDVTRGV